MVRPHSLGCASLRSGERQLALAPLALTLAVGPAEPDPTGSPGDIAGARSGGDGGAGARSLTLASHGAVWGVPSLGFASLFSEGAA
jgi:hypothetical protein